ncbi:MAG TPA: hypothetical protein VFH48_03765 [Chloroflexota bacterium]|nr:hypothetical protein [Chloroflexota bacterium]
MIAAVPRRGWRWRRCPSCHAVERAGQFVAVQYGPSWEGGAIPRRCPNCGHVAATYKFRVVREAHHA